MNRVDRSITSPQWRWWPKCVYTICGLHVPNL
uniref:Transducin family protein n=1 Tax=Rhizophora mucronata TaxID=61149 RepID=A0A2P2LN99_RHIMU